MSPFHPGETKAPEECRVGLNQLLIIIKTKHFFFLIQEVFLVGATLQVTPNDSEPGEPTVLEGRLEGEVRRPGGSQEADTGQEESPGGRGWRLADGRPLKKLEVTQVKRTRLC